MFYKILFFPAITFSLNSLLFLISKGVEEALVRIVLTAERLTLKMLVKSWVPYLIPTY